MNNNVFTEIDSLHSSWSRLDNAKKLGWLAGKKMQLNSLANQLSWHISANGGFMNGDEREIARKLLEMINAVDVEGRKILQDTVEDALRAWVNELMKLVSK